MDQNVKLEFQRKDEAIHTLQQSIESQLKTISGWIKQEEHVRTQLEVTLRTELQK